MKKTKLTSTQTTDNLLALNTNNKEKKLWNDPQIEILSVKNDTLGAALINDDNAGFS
jgi:hypothetical protein